MVQTIVRIGWNNYTSLKGAEFEIYSVDVDKMSFSSTYLSASNSNGVFFVGDLPYGTYYLKEVVVPSGASSTNLNKWYCVIVDGTGTYMSSSGYNNKGNDTNNRASALSDAKEVKASS